ncbi:hypothetical protein [Acidaminococcus timonensis]|uniref:hypothetical protein n=1 Tax=Acidaminococcus timonensis TaxID=1871002 RepID=UPI00115FB30D|nr:hypothetical protein [Acidaminococcus timonensis]
MAMEQKMSDTAFRICLWEVMGLPTRDLYAQLAEEGAELTQAALKCIRAQGFSQNPTPVSCEDAIKNLREEINDVLIAAYVLGLVDSSCVKDWSKLVRWAKRLQEANEKKEAANGCAER